MLTPNEIMTFIRIYQLNEATEAAPRRVLEALRNSTFGILLFLLPTRKILPAGTIHLQWCGHALSELLNLLRQRWQRIQNTNSAYLCDATNPANQLFTWLASELQKQYHYDWYNSLMPGIVEVDLQLRVGDFILTDDNREIIDVIKSLKSYARTGEMHVTYPDAKKPLTASERKRLVEHTHATEKYVGVVTELRAMRERTGTVGFALQELLIELHEGSDKKDGVAATQLRPNVSQAIDKFSKIFKQLSLDQYAQLLSASYFTQRKAEVTFQYVWQVLQRVKAGLDRNPVFSVESVVYDIEQILGLHPELYEISIEHKSESDADYCQAKLAQLDVELDAAYENVDKFTDFAYPKVNENAMFAAIISEVDARYLLLNTKLIDLHRELSQENQHHYLMALLNLGEAGLQFICKGIINFNQLHNILSTLDEQHKKIILVNAGVLNKLLKPKGKKRKAEFVDDVLHLLNQFTDKSEIINSLPDLYADVAEIKQLAVEQSAEQDAGIGGAMDLDEPPAAPSFDEVLRAQSIDVRTPTDLGSPVSSEVSEEKESLEGHEPPRKKLRFDDSLPTQVLAHTTHFKKVETTPQKKTRATIISGLLRKTKDAIDLDYPLEAMRYLMHAHIFLREMECLDPDWSTKQLSRLRSLVIQAIESTADVDRWEQCVDHYRCEVHPDELAELIGYAHYVPAKLLNRTEEHFYLKQSFDTVLEYFQQCQPPRRLG